MVRRGGAASTATRPSVHAAFLTTLATCPTVASMSYFDRWWWVIRRWWWAVKPYRVLIFLILVLGVMFLVGMCGQLYLHQQLRDAGY